MKNNNHKDQLFCCCSGGKDRRSVVVVNSKESDRRCLAEWKKKRIRTIKSVKFESLSPDNSDSRVSQLDSTSI